jgi:magnesium-transporting ATPase (P-type)
VKAVSVHDIVVGDIVIVEAGDKVRREGGREG